MKKLVLSANCIVRPADKGKAKHVTSVTLFVSGVIACSAKLGGKFTAEQAIAEFKKNPQRFSRLTKQHEAALLLAKV